MLTTFKRALAKLCDVSVEGCSGVLARQQVDLLTQPAPLAQCTVVSEECARQSCLALINTRNTLVSCLGHETVSLMARIDEHLAKGLPFDKWVDSGKEQTQLEPHVIQILIGIAGSILLARYLPRWWRKFGAWRQRLEKSGRDGTDISSFLDPVFMTKVLAGEVVFGDSLSFPVATMLANPRTAQTRYPDTVSDNLFSPERPFH